MEVAEAERKSGKRGIEGGMDGCENRQIHLHPIFYVFHSAV